MTKILRPICLMVILVMVFALSILLFPLGSPLAAAPDENLLTNPGAETGDMSGWTIIASGGYGWTVGGGGYEGDECFGTSYNWCKRYQEIDLLAEGYTVAQLDGAPPTITVSEWFVDYGFGSGDYVYLKVELRDREHNAIASYDTGVFQLTAVDGYWGPWEQKSHVFSDYGAGLRYIYFEDGGDDCEYWAGYWGPRLDAASVTITPYEEVAAAFSATPMVGEAPLTVQFRNKSTGEIYDDGWLWDFGDGRGHLRNPSHTYYNEGTYRICLTVTGPGGEDRACKTITVESMAVPGKISVRNLNITPVYAQPRQAVAISANVANEGGIWGSQTVNLMINGQFEQSTSVGVAPGTAQPINFTVYKVEPGEYQVEIAGVTGTFHVMETKAAAAPKTGLLAGGELDSGGIIAIVVIGIILVGGVILAVLFTRRA